MFFQIFLPARNKVLRNSKIKMKKALRRTLFLSGAGDGNRTHAASLEGWNSTIEQHPLIQYSDIISQGRGFVNSFLKFF